MQKREESRQNERNREKPESQFDERLRRARFILAVSGHGLYLRDRRARLPWDGGNCLNCI